MPSVVIAGIARAYVLRDLHNRRVDDALFIHPTIWWMDKASAARPDPPYTAPSPANAMPPDNDPTHKHSRAEFHQANQARAEAEAQRLLTAKPELGGRWLSWVAAELYALKPATYAQMVRRELQRLSDAP